MCNLYSLTKVRPRSATGSARDDRTGNLPLFPGISPTKWPDRSQWSRWRARACYGALGHARATAVWRRADHQHSQSRQPALARVARQAKPLHRASDVVCEYADTKPRWRIA